MDVLKRKYPQVLDIFLEGALEDADGDVLEALELLRINLGDPIEGLVNPLKRLTIDLVEFGTSGYGTAPGGPGKSVKGKEPEINQDVGVQANCGKNESPTPLHVYTAIRPLYPNVDFEVTSPAE